LGGRFIRAENPQTFKLKSINDSGSQRTLGAYNGEINFIIKSKDGQRFDIARLYIQIFRR
jgi:hypothetical protein